MFSKTVSAWLFYAITLPSSPALARQASSPLSSEPPSEFLQERPRAPQFAVDACRNLSEGAACTIEFQGQTLSGTCKKMGEEGELVCLPAGQPPGAPPPS